MAGMLLASSAGYAQPSCAASSVVYDLTGPTCPNGDERCNFSTGFHFYKPAGGPGTPLLLMTTGYDLNTYQVTQLSATTQAWQPVQTTVFRFATQYRSLNRILLEVDVDPATGLGIAPYQDKPVRIFQITAQNSVEELWRNPYDGTFPNTGLTGAIFSLPGASGPRHFAAWVNNASLEIFEVLLGSPVQVISRHNTGVEFIKVVAKRGNPTYLYGLEAANRVIRVYRVQLDAAGNLQVTQTATLTPYSETTDGLEAFAGLALDPDTGRLYSSAHKIVSSPKTYVECWETASNPAQPTFRSRLLIPSAKLSRTLAARGGWVIATSTDPSVFFNHPLSFHNPDAPMVVNTWANFPQPVGDSRNRIGPNGAALISDPNNNVGVAFADVEWAALVWLNPACANATPMAGVGVTRQGNSGTPTCTPGTVAAHGFPGDSFAVKDESTGSNYTVSEVKVIGVDPHNASYQWLGTPPQPGGTVIWPGSETLPRWGRFQVSLKILRQDQTTDTATKEVYLCHRPQARAAVVATRPRGGTWTSCTTCTWLRGDSLKLSAAASDGHPNLPETSWQVEHGESSQGPFQPVPAQDGQVVHWEVTNGELALHLLRQGFYRARASVVYAFASQPLEALSPVLPSAAVGASIRVEQPQGTVVPVGGTVRSSSPVHLVAVTQLASGWQVTSYAWTVVEQGSGSTVASGSTPELIVTSGLENGKSYRAHLTVVASDGSQQETVVTSRDFAVQDVAGDFTWSPENPAVGQDVTFTPTGLSAGITRLRWNLGDPLCDNSGPQVEKACVHRVCTLKVKLANSGSRTVTLEALVGSTWYQVASKTVTATPGACQSCTPATAPTLRDPAEGATVNAGQPVSFSWSAANGTSPITYTLITASSGLGSGSCTTTDTTSCAIIFTMPGTYNWSVRATNSCNQTGASSSARTFTVVQGSSCNPPAAPTPLSPDAGAQLSPGNVTFSWQTVAGATSYAVRLWLGALDLRCSPDSPTSTSCTRELNTPGSYTWTVSATNSCGSTTSAERAFTITSPCGSLGAPSLVSPADGATVSGAEVTLRWSAPTQGQSPFTYNVWVDNTLRAENLSALETTVSGVAAGLHSWYVVAKDSCGQTSRSAPRTFVMSSCAVAAPEPDFTWQPSGRDPDFPNQMQPFAGQEVTLTYIGAGGPPEHYHWYDFQQSPPKSVQGPNVTEVKHTWTEVSGSEYQDMNVRLKVRNCAGSPPELLKPVRVYKDIRPVLARFTTQGPAVAGQPVQFLALAGRSEGNPTRFEWDFGDGSPKQTLETPQVEHTYSCGRTYQVTLTAWRGSVKSVPITKAVAVGGKPCAPLALVVPDVAIEVDSPFAPWRSELVLFNPEDRDLTAQVRARTRDHREFTGQLTIPLRAAANLNDLRGVLRDSQGGSLPDDLTVTLWVEAPQGNRLPLVGARTYTEPGGGGSYGQAVPVYPLYPAETTATTLWVVGAQHNGRVNGFRTNLTIVNPASVRWGRDKGITLTLYDQSGQRYEKRLTAFGARQYDRHNPITAFFGLNEETDLGKFSLKVEVDPGVQALVVCSVNDNFTNDSFALLAQPDVD